MKCQVCTLGVYVYTSKIDQNALCIFQISKHGVFKCVCTPLTLLTSTHSLCVCVLREGTVFNLTGNLHQEGVSSDRGCVSKGHISRHALCVSYDTRVHVQRGLRAHNFRGFVLCEHVRLRPIERTCAARDLTHT